MSSALRRASCSRPIPFSSACLRQAGALKGVGKVYLRAVLDTYGSYAFGFLRVSKQPEPEARRWRCCTTTCCPSIVGWICP